MSGERTVPGTVYPRGISGNPVRLYAPPDDFPRTAAGSPLRLTGTVSENSRGRIYKSVRTPFDTSGGIAAFRGAIRNALPCLPAREIFSGKPEFS